MFPLLSLSPRWRRWSGRHRYRLYGAACAFGPARPGSGLAAGLFDHEPVGYVPLPLGAGSVSGALFHLLVHAFCSVVHGRRLTNFAAGEQQLAYSRAWPAVIRCCCGCCWPAAPGLAGVPLTSGFFSKDAILMATLTTGGSYYTILGGLGLLAALLTALYSFRLLYVRCGNRQPNAVDHALPLGMLWPLWPLTLLGLGGGMLNLPPLWGGHLGLQNYLDPAGVNHHPQLSTELIMGATAALLVLAAWLWSRYRYWRTAGGQPLAAGWRTFSSGWRC
ncbi:MAG: proton-conducting transporter membrane subunit [Syntrophotaleaceae bacterium]